MILFIIAAAIALVILVINTFFLSGKKKWKGILFILGVLSIGISAFQFYAEKAELKLLRSQIVKQDPFRARISTGIADLNVSVESDQDIDNYLADRGAILGFFKQGEQVLTMVSLDSWVKKVDDGIVLFSARVSMLSDDPAVNDPVSSLEDVDWMGVIFTSPFFPDNSIVTGGQVIITINSNVRFELDVPRQKAEKRSDGFNYIVIPATEILEAFNEASSTVHHISPS